MPRLRRIPRHEVTDPLVLHAYEHKFGDRDPVAEPGTVTGAPGDAETVLAASPHLFGHVMQGFGSLRQPGITLDPVLAELAKTRVAWVVGSRFVFSQHCKALRAVGATVAQVEAIPHWEVASCYSATERAVLAYVDGIAMDGGRTPTAVANRIRCHLPETDVLVVTYIAGMFSMLSRFMRALRLEFDDVDDPTVEVPAPAGFIDSDLIPPGRPPQAP